MKRIYLLPISLLFMLLSYSQEFVTYQKPSGKILSLLDAKRAPSILLNDSHTLMILRYRDNYKSIEELSEKELRLAGLRLNPDTNIGSRITYYNNLMTQQVGSKSPVQVKGIPINPKLANFSWSPDQKKIALTNTTDKGVEVWIIDLQTNEATKLTEAVINANLPDPVIWFKDSTRLLVKILPQQRVPLLDTNTSVPRGPNISINNGKKAQNRTYQDLLKNTSDEHNFEQLTRSVLIEVDLNGNQQPFLPNAMYSNISFSPDGNYISITTIEKPFSYLVPYKRFPSKTDVYDNKGKHIKSVLAVPLLEDLPKGFMATQKGPRDFGWRNDKPATLHYVVALDEGDPSINIEYRDEVFEWDAPFNSPARSLLKVHNRLSNIQWGNNRLAIAYDNWWNNRNTKTYLFNPSNSSLTPKIISDRNYQDLYSDPGLFMTEKNEMASTVLTIKNDNLFLVGDGFSEKGQFPFVDQFNTKTFQKERVYQSKHTDKKENIIRFDVEKKQLLVQIESKNQFPNYYFYSLKGKLIKKLTYFSNPYQILQDIHKEVITYKRNDGLDLSATLYLPIGYTTKTAKNLPMILWAYPREYKDLNSAAQSTQNPNEFIYPSWGSPIYWVTKGYVVLDDASFPIVGKEETEPNDSFRSQLIANAEAAINAVWSLGYIDKTKVAVGGHSYGAFMVANLLSHTNLFAAGIARSGAYNRTLTPFGFQSEERNYWEAPEIYYEMSPFMHADKMKTPLLLVHGEADNNSGTYPLQSIRYFNALKGLGATVRLVMLPEESHGYRAKESIYHLIWEQDQWLETYVK